MNRTCFITLPVFLLASFGAAWAQPDPGECLRVRGGLELNKISDTVIEAKLDGGLEGTLSLDVLHDSVRRFGPDVGGIQRDCQLSWIIAPAGCCQ